MRHHNIQLITRYLKPYMRIYLGRYGNRQPQRLILMYHGISSKHQYNCVTQSLFREQLIWLKQHYSVIPLTSMVKKLEAEPANKENIASITFDDGYRNFAEFAVPILEENECHATLFVPTAKVGLYNDWDAGHPMFEQMKIMTYEQLRSLPESLVEIGSHGLSHVRLDNLCPFVLEREIIDSQIELEQNIGRPVTLFSFPFGVYPFQDSDNVQYLLSSCYRAACTSRWGRHNSVRNLYALRRIGIWETDSFTDFIEKHLGLYDWMICKEYIGFFIKNLRHLCSGI